MKKILVLLPLIIIIACPLNVESIESGDELSHALIHIGTLHHMIYDPLEENLTIVEKYNHIKYITVLTDEALENKEFSITQQNIIKEYSYSLIEEITIQNKEINK